MNKVLVENKGEFVVLVNPIGDETFGFLHWDEIKFFKDRNKAEEFQKK